MSDPLDIFNRSDENGNRFIIRSSLYPIQPTHGFRLERIDPNAVNRVGWKGDNISAFQELNGLIQ